MNAAAEAGAAPVLLIIRWDVPGRNPFVLRLASNYSSAQGSVLFQLIGVGSESTAKWTNLSPSQIVYAVRRSVPHVSLCCNRSAFGDMKKSGKMSRPGRNNGRWFTRGS